MIDRNFQIHKIRENIFYFIYFFPQTAEINGWQPAPYMSLRGNNTVKTRFFILVVYRELCRN